ncbi:tRNA (adenosine(37)-N6)-threonylcarbamoyltransferase complex ATPase subunit type 1 TsaE [Candidatus Sumerlaeota bacterium]|nr:tRNA (adenosine(37)-N6)-threonylcarbamoyltransferase complex ATPase subunit type 1 TsaE [Candidatus Sumerlaeota bacterium]
MGEILGRILSGGEILALTGELGSGKTTFVKGLARGLGITDVITSPTFVVVKSYPGRLILHHIDFYRLTETGDFETIGFDDYREHGAVVAVEWAEKFLQEMGSDCLHILFGYEGENIREIRFESQRRPEWESRLKKELTGKA